ncbi:MAG: hypothetical protein RQ757_01755 [Pseudomonadales bacterium]|nr:hypothetical protein [Pseudomonadales bacterium]
MGFGNAKPAIAMLATSFAGRWSGQLLACAKLPVRASGRNIRQVSLVLSLSLLSACASQQHEIIETASIPLNDFNIIRPKIPLILEDSHLGPYELPVDTSCDHINAYVAVLDQALGPDVDAPRVDLDESLWERGTDTVGDYSSDALERAVRGLIPFRSWIRLLSGAESHSELLDRTIASGVIRRAYLKGLRQALSCPMPPVVKPQLVYGLIADLTAKSAARELAEQAAKEEADKRDEKKSEKSRCWRTARWVGLCDNTEDSSIAASSTSQGLTD